MKHLCLFGIAGLSSSSGNYQVRQRESVQSVLKLQIIIILISYIIIKLLINENHSGQNRKRNSHLCQNSIVLLFYPQSAHCVALLRNKLKCFCSWKVFQAILRNALPSNVRLALKILPRTNTLAYLRRSFTDEEKKFYKIPQDS